MGSDVIAVETHSSHLWGLISLLAILGPVLSLALVPSRLARVALAAVAVIGFSALPLAWAGFQYRFLRHGVEIRTLGFHLRSIPKQAIVSYSIEPWTWMRGYGIRGIGSTRAYVWGNQVVHIRTTNGEVFLGHSDPVRIVRDLDRMTGFASQDNQQTAPAIPVHNAEHGDAMSRTWYTPAIWLMWLVLPITALNYWQAWDHLPARMAVHFDANWQPNGYTSREGALTLGLGIMAFILVIFTVGGFILRAAKSSPAWPMLAFFYVVLGVAWYGNNRLIEFNLHRNDQPAHSEWIGSPSRLQVTLTDSQFLTCICNRRRYVQRDFERSPDLDFRWARSDGRSVPDERNGEALSQSWSARGTHRVWPGRDAGGEGPRHAGAADGADLPRTLA
jgi:hypothetical protein